MKENNEHEFQLQTCTVVVPACLVRRYKGKLKNYYLNLNQYVKWDKFLRNNLKIQFTRHTKSEIMRLPVMKKIHYLKYTLVIPTKRKRDRMNVYSIVDKFFCDALQVHGRIEDDSDEFINDFIFTKTEYIRGEEKDIRVSIDIYFE